MLHSWAYTSCIPELERLSCILTYFQLTRGDARFPPAVVHHALRGFLFCYSVIFSLSLCLLVSGTKSEYALPKVLFEKVCKWFAFCSPPHLCGVVCSNPGVMYCGAGVNLTTLRRSDRACTGHLYMTLGCQAVLNDRPLKAPGGVGCVPPHRYMTG